VGDGTSSWCPDQHSVTRHIASVVHSSRVFFTLFAIPFPMSVASLKLLRYVCMVFWLRYYHNGASHLYACYDGTMTWGRIAGFNRFLSSNTIKQLEDNRFTGTPT